MSRDDDKRKKKTRDWQGGRSSIPFYVRGLANGNTTYGEGIALFLFSIFLLYFSSVFATGQSVNPEPGRGRTAVCRPVRSFSKVARQVGLEDEDGLRFTVLSRPGLLAAPRRALRGPGRLRTLFLLCDSLSTLTKLCQ